MCELPAALRVDPAAAGFFDWASLSPLSLAAVDAQRRYLTEAAAATDPPTAMRAFVDLATLRASIGSFVASSAHHDVVLGRSASEFLSVLAHGMDKPGRNEVVLCEPNHPCLPLAWVSAAEARGMTVHTVAALPTRHVDLDALEEVLDEKCAAVLVTHVDHLHGVVQPVEEVSRLARAVGAAVIVDGAQAVGRIPVDLGGLGADAYIGVGRKSLLSPIGTAFLVADRALLTATRPLVWSTRSANLDAAGRAVPVPSPIHLEGNLPDLGALSALEASLDAFNAPVLTRLQSQVRSQLPLLLEGMLDAALEPLCSTGPDNAGIVSFRLPPSASGPQLQDNLRKAGLVVAASASEIRVSLHLANGNEDLERLIREVRTGV